MSVQKKGSFLLHLIIVLILAFVTNCLFNQKTKFLYLNKSVLFILEN